VRGPAAIPRPGANDDGNAGAPEMGARAPAALNFTFVSKYVSKLFHARAPRLRPARPRPRRARSAPVPLTKAPPA
jgi:hypothetical protein